MALLSNDFITFRICKAHHWWPPGAGLCSRFPSFPHSAVLRRCCIPWTLFSFFHVSKLLSSKWRLLFQRYWNDPLLIEFVFFPFQASGWERRIPWQGYGSLRVPEKSWWWGGDTQGPPRSSWACSGVWLVLSVASRVGTRGPDPVQLGRVTRSLSRMRMTTPGGII